MRRARAYGFTLSFQDMLMAMIAIYAFLFLIAYALIKPADAKTGIELKAEYLLALEWPPGNLATTSTCICEVRLPRASSHRRAQPQDRHRGVGQVSGDTTLSDCLLEVGGRRDGRCTRAGEGWTAGGDAAAAGVRGRDKQSAREHAAIQ